jgi:L-ascorbate metabolism protein UlaG (beta-lactamase superfamily)
MLRFPLYIEVPAISGMSLVFLNSARQALLLDPLDAGGITTAMPCLDSAFAYVATGAVRIVHHLFDHCFYTTR